MKAKMKKPKRVSLAKKVIDDGSVKIKDKWKVEYKILKKMKVTIDDPCLLFDWHDDVASNFVLHWNLNPNNLPRPAWLLAPTVTVSSLKDGIIEYAASVAGGRIGNIGLAPNSFVQYTSCILLLRNIEMDQLVQFTLQQLQPNAKLATLHFVHDKSIVKAAPLNWSVPLGLPLF